MTSYLIITALVVALVSVSVYAFVARRRAWQAFDTARELARTLSETRTANSKLHRENQELLRAIDKYYEIEAKRLDPMFRLADGYIRADKDILAETVVLTRDVRYPVVRYAITNEELYNINPFGTGRIADGFCEYLANRMAREYTKALLPEFVSFAKKWSAHG